MNGSEYKTQLSTIKSSFSSLLDNFYNTYIIHHTNPDSAEYNQIYSQEKGQINSLNTSLFSLQTDIKQSITFLEKDLTQVNKTLDVERALNVKLHKKFDDKKGKELGALGLIVESKESYNHQYFKNIGLFLGDILLVYVLYKIVK
jgi:hypothetical protein